MTENGAGLGTVTGKMVQVRADELALIDGRSPRGASIIELEQAKRELTGEPDMDPKDALLESAPESERWDPVHGSTGHKVPISQSEDEDEDGRIDCEILIDEGRREASHDQMLQAARKLIREN